MARSVDLNDETPLVTDEVDDEIAEDCLPAKLGAFAAPISHVQLAWL
jgi:hypothetical protein